MMSCYKANSAKGLASFLRYGYCISAFGHICIDNREDTECHIIL